MIHEDDKVTIFCLLSDIGELEKLMTVKRDFKINIGQCRKGQAWARFQNTVRIQGAMLLVLAASMLIPFIQAVYYQENSSAKAFAIVFARMPQFRIDHQTMHPSLLGKI